MSVVHATKIRALAEAKSLLQTYGFNGFSFQHVADALGIRKPSLYVHFTSKEGMGNELIENYSTHFKDWTKTLPESDPEENIRSFFHHFFEFSIQERRYCPLAALIGDYNSLPPSMQKNLVKAFKAQQKWLKQIIENGQYQNVFSDELDAEGASQTILAMSLGSQQIGRITGQAERIHAIGENAVKFLRTRGAE